MAKWSAFPHAGDYTFDAAGVRRGDDPTDYL